MARAKKTSDRSYLHSREKKIEIIQEAFPEMRRLLMEKKALQAKHVKPLADSFNTVTGRLKAETGVDREDWYPDFLKYMRDQNALDMDKKADTDRIQANLRLMHDAMVPGEMVNFLDALEKEPAPAAANGPDGDDLDSDEDHGGSDASDTVTELAVEAVVSSEEAPVIEEETAQAESDWGANEVGTTSDTDDDAGRAFQLGEEAGHTGAKDVKDILKAHGKHHLTTWGKSCKAGHAKGLKDFQRAKSLQTFEDPKPDQVKEAEAAAPLPAVDADAGGIFSQAAEDGENVLQFHQSVPLPTLHTGVATSSGDRA